MEKKNTAQSVKQMELCQYHTLHHNDIGFIGKTLNVFKKKEKKTENILFGFVLLQNINFQ